MTIKKSTHVPEMTGSLGETVPAATGTLIIDTGLRNLIGFTCSLAEDADAAVAGCSWELVTQVAGTTQKVTLKTWEDDGTSAGSGAHNVSWIAIGN